MGSWAEEFPLADPAPRTAVSVPAMLARARDACCSRRAWLPCRAMIKAGTGVPCARVSRPQLFCLRSNRPPAPKRREREERRTVNARRTEKAGRLPSPPYQKAISALEIAVDARQERKRPSLQLSRPAGCFLRTPTVLFPLLPRFPWSRPIPALFRPVYRRTFARNSLSAACVCLSFLPLCLRMPGPGAKLCARTVYTCVRA